MSSRDWFPATVYYSGDGYSTAGPKLMGRQAAGQGFLRGYVNACQKQGQMASAWLALPSKQAEDETRAGFQHAGLASPLEVLSSRNMSALKQSGCLYVPQPNLADLASQRIRVGESQFSLCGITHTTASHAVMSTLAQLPLVPLRPWDAVICTSQAVLKSVHQLLDQQFEYLKWKLGATRFELPQLPVIPLGVHVKDYEFSEAQKNAARAKLGLNENDVAVLFVGRLSFHAKAHPHPMLVALQNVAKKSNKEIHLIQAGWFANQPIEQAFKQAALELSPDVQHHYLDGRDSQQRTTAWAAADIFCSLADNIQETFGLTPIEAMAASLPAVVSDWDGYKDTVRHAVDGYRVPTTLPEAGDGLELASLYERGLINYDMYCGYSCEFVSVDIAKATEYFEALIESPELRLKMGQSAHARAVNNYDWTVVMDEYQSLWRSLRDVRLASEKLSVGPIPIQGAVDRPDPFDLFSGYSTHTLGLDTKIHLHHIIDQAEFNKTLMLSVHRYAALMLPNWQQAEAVVHRLAKSDASVQELLREVDSVQHSQFRRHLMWMMKVGWLTAV
jgi:glycosyltransferase involved in cell wall biosynthesis